jgi:phosphopentomutase
VRALVLVLDSVGIGDAPDAATYGDAGANTLGHILERLPELRVPNLCSLGLPAILSSVGRDSVEPKVGSPPRLDRVSPCQGSYGRMQERSAGKDTTTGHWEIAGVILEEPFAVYESFPEELVRAIEREAGVQFIGNYARSGTTILEELGAEHVRTGKPILYTSADSVLQIAAHEAVVPIGRLYAICQVAKEQSDRYRIGRVIARPFAGPEGNFVRTPRRHDFSMKPPRTILNAVSEEEIPVIGVGKISDIFAGEGITQSFPTTDNTDGMERIDAVWDDLATGLLFANLVDFDMLHGHRRDVAGYGRALEEFDRWLGEFVRKVRPEDLVIITADHGNDPTFTGTDHTREQVPLFVMHNATAQELGTRETFADIAATVADYFKVKENLATGTSFLPELEIAKAAVPGASK